MRSTIFVAVPMLAALATTPAAGQVSARLHLDIPIGRQRGVAYVAPRQSLLIRDYDPNVFGAWDSYYDDWVPETVYFYDGAYYDYPIVAYAEPIVVYRYRNEFFFAPREREFIRWREQRNFRGDDRRFRPAPQFGWDRRDDRQFRPVPQFGRDGRDGGQFRPAPQFGRDGRDGGQFRPAPQNGRDGRDGGQFRPAPQSGRDGHDVRPGTGDQRGGSQPRGGDRSRSRPH